MDVTAALSASLSDAKDRFPEVYEGWRKASFLYGGRLPRSLLIGQLQKLGKLDVLIRCLEQEFRPDYSDLEALDTQTMLSEHWVSSVYEVLRLLKSRNLEASDPFIAMMRDFELVRITLDKHEVAGDRKLKEPLQMVSAGKGPTTTYSYDPLDPTRSHIMRVGINPRGSICWEVLDLKTDQQRWLERRYLSDRLLAITADASRTSAA